MEGLNQSLAIGSFKPGDILTGRQAMLLAIQESQKGWGFVSPNPMVGCVILDSQSRLLASGYHAKYGGPHAEINAIEKVPGLFNYNKPQIKGPGTFSWGDALKDATVYVTLEPCAHQGKTGSCAVALSKLPIKKVYFGLIDPNPLVSGRGKQILRDNGIECEVYQDSDPEFQKQLTLDLEFSCEHFLKNIRQQKPFVALKVATSIDGQLAASDGSSRWITDEEARLHVHYLRAGYDAILTGSGTLLADDPQLTIRHPQFPELKSKKVVLLDRKGVLNSRLDWKLLKEHSPENILWFTSLNESELNPGLKVRPLSYVGDDLNKILTEIWLLGIKSVFIECGPKLLNSFIKALTFDRLYLFQAPIILGAKSGYSWTTQVTMASMEQRLNLQTQAIKTFKRSVGGVDLFTSCSKL